MKLWTQRRLAPIAATSGQIAHEWRHLLRKLAGRDAALHRRWTTARRPACHPTFRRVPGQVAEWERA